MASQSWDHVAWLARALWACRVSVLSGLAGVLLFYVAVPAQNLFADQSFAGVYQVLYWLGVFALVFLVWAFPSITTRAEPWIGKPGCCRTVFASSSTKAVSSPS